MPLFGGRRAVWVKAGSRNFAAAVEAVVARPPRDCRVVIEAGDLRTHRAAAHHLREGEVRRRAALLRRQRARPGRGWSTTRCARPSSPSRPTRAPRWCSLLGGDRQALAQRDPQARALCARQGPRHARRRDRGGGRRVRARRSTAWSTRRSPAARPTPRRSSPRRWPPAPRPAPSCRGRCATSRSCTRRALALDAGEDNYAAMRSFVPPIHFRRQPAVEAALKAWTAPRLARAMEQLADAAFNVRRTARARRSAGAARPALARRLGAAEIATDSTLAGAADPRYASHRSIRLPR